MPRGLDIGTLRADFPGRLSGRGSCVGVPGLQFFGRPGTFLGFFVPGLHLFGRPGTLGEGNNVEGTGFRCAGGGGAGGAPRRRPALGAPPGRAGFRSLRSRYPWGGGIQGLERPGPRGGPVGFSVNVGAQASLAPPLTEKARRIACARPFKSLSGKRDSDPRPQPWQGCALPTELFPQLGLQI